MRRREDGEMRNGIQDHNCQFIRHIIYGGKRLLDEKEMRARGLLVSGITFLVLGALVFFFSEEIRVQVEILPISAILAVLLAAGVVLLVYGLSKSLYSVLSSAWT